MYLHARNSTALKVLNFNSMFMRKRGGKRNRSAWDTLAQFSRNLSAGSQKFLRIWIQRIQLYRKSMFWVRIVHPDLQKTHKSEPREQSQKNNLFGTFLRDGTIGSCSFCDFCHRGIKLYQKMFIREIREKNSEIERRWMVLVPFRPIFFECLRLMNSDVSSCEKLNGVESFEF